VELDYSTTFLQLKDRTMAKSKKKTATPSLKEIKAVAAKVDITKLSDKLINRLIEKDFEEFK
jgi:hypothetical protein